MSKGPNRLVVDSDVLELETAVAGERRKKNGNMVSRLVIAEKREAAMGLKHPRLHAQVW